MSDREKLLQYISNLTNEEAEEFVTFLGTAPSSEAVSTLPPQNNSQQAQTVSA